MTFPLPPAGAPALVRTLTRAARRGLGLAGSTPWLAAGLGLLYPNWCQICRRHPAEASDGFVCHACQAAVRRLTPPFCQRCGLPFHGEAEVEFTCSNCADLLLHFETARAAVHARGVALEVIHRYKYGQARWFEPLLSRWLIEAAGPVLATEPWTAVVPVPLHPAREREREFNQAERLARHLADALRLPLRADLVRRTRATGTQTQLSREERQVNVARAFAPTGRGRLDGGSVVVVDDVVTTGSTTSAVAAALRRLGARRVVAWSVARGV
ncbi:MAG: double zinc ribbon domain-containing protein [Verrucomicrobiota bacterium]